MWVELASIPFEVKCRFPENEAFLKDYETPKTPLFTVEPTDKDLEMIQAKHDRSARAGGKVPQQLERPFLENTALMLLSARELVAHDVLLIHSSALCMDGEGYLFMAPSGTGKSTHARLWREVFGDRVWMVNDDMPMLRIEKSRVMVCGTPWNGKHRLGLNASVPLKAIVWLYRSETNQIQPLSKAEAFPFVVHQAFGYDDLAIQSKIMNLEVRLLELVSRYKLGCTISTEAPSVAWEGMNTGYSC